MAISSISSNAIYTNQFVLKVNTTKSQTENTQSSANSTAFGDTVNISAEAQNRLQSVQAANSTDTADTTDTAQSDTTGKASSGGSGASAPAKSGGASTASSGSTSSTSTSSADAIAKLEKEIQALQNEITSLAAKALSDETAKSEMAAKQQEMAGLTAELTQLQTQQA
ncbi:MAG: hypothetical protein V2B20_03430 [Pseudomonadota bacterium]